MSDTVISVENLSKEYRLGVISTGTFYGDLKRWWAMQRGKPDPYLRIDESDHGNRLGETIWALRDVSFTVKQGETLGIIGRNGAGKSTLLKILSQVTAPTSGVIKVKGRIASLLEVGTGFHPELTGRENIFLNGAIMGMDKAEVERKFDEIVDFSGVEKFIDTPVKRYSSGMYVRLAFAVAAYLEPEILVVDEVLAVGDAEFQKKCLGKMKDVSGEGRTVLFVSHNMGSISSLCTKGLYVSHGKVVTFDEIHKVIAQYLFDASIVNVFDKDFSDDKIGDNFVKLVRIRFIDETSNTVERFVVSKKFGIEISYQILRAGIYRPTPNVFFRTQTEERVFQSLETNPVAFGGEGFYRSVAWIPANLLNNGNYIITVGIATLNPVYIHCSTDIQIQVADDPLAVTRGDYRSQMHGNIRPLLYWDTERVS